MTEQQFTFEIFSCILTSQQDQRIRALKIPVEICPSCHQMLDWWKKDQPHPILSLYQIRSQVIAETDDKGEQQKLDAIFEGEEQEADKSKTAQRRKRYMFS